MTRPSPANVLTAALIGTGKISEEHLKFLTASPRVRVLGVCDLSPSLARYASERFGAGKPFTDHATMLSELKPDVVHVLTPPATHVKLVGDCLRAGAHVIVEKPVAPTHTQFLELAALANSVGRRLIEDHNYRFNRPVLKIERLVKEGPLGEVHEVDVRMALNVRKAGSRYADPHLPHPSHHLPAGVIHEFVTHLSYLALRFGASKTEGDWAPRVAAAWSKHGDDTLFTYDDLDALVIDGSIHRRIRFTSHAGPDAFTLTVRGSRGWAETDLFQPYLRVVRPRLGGAQLSPLVNHVANGASLVAASVRGFCNKVMQVTPYEGLQRFLTETYDALTWGGEPPVTFEDMDRASRLVDALLSHPLPRTRGRGQGEGPSAERRRAREGEAPAEPRFAAPSSSPETEHGAVVDRGSAGASPSQLPAQLDRPPLTLPSPPSTGEMVQRVCITGANGFLGGYVVAEALRRGHHVRALVRSKEEAHRHAWATHPNVELVEADLRSRRGLSDALRAVDCVIHLAAAKSGDIYAQYAGTVVATENLLAAMTEAGVRQIVAVSSLSVYDYRRIANFDTLDEDSPVETTAFERDEYAHTKLVQERLIREHAAKHDWNWTVLRPGVIWGKGNFWTARLGIPGGRVWIRTGGVARLPLTYVENCAEAILLAAEQPIAHGQIFNVIDDEQPTQREFAKRLKRQTSPNAVIVPVPLTAMRAIATGADLTNRLLLRRRAKIPGLFIPARLEARCRPLSFANQKAKSFLGWTPRYSLAEAMRRSTEGTP